MLKGRFALPQLYVCLALILAFAGVSVALGTMTSAAAAGFAGLVLLAVSQILVVRHWRRGRSANG